MARPSSISRLPPEIRGEISRLREQGRTIDEVLAHLRLLGVEPSRSALGRHVHTLEKMGERLRRSRAMAEALVRQRADAPESEVARMNIEMLHSTMFEIMTAAEDDDEEEGAAGGKVRDPKVVAQLAVAAERLTKASQNNLKFIQEVEKRAADKARRESATAAESAGREAGLSAETIGAIKARILGLKG